MSGPTPIAVTHRLHFSVQISGGLTHNLHYLVDAVASGDTDGYDFVNSRGGSAIPMSQVVTRVAAIYKAFYPNTASIGGFVLEHYVLGAYLPVATDSTSVAGTGTGIIKAGWVVFALKGYTTRIMKGAVLTPEEGSNPLPYHTRLRSDLSTPQTALWDFLTTNGDPANAYNWARFRNDDPIGAIVGVTGSYNRKLRRKHGLI